MPRSSRSQLLYWLLVLGISENLAKIVPAPETCSATKYRYHHAVYLLSLSEYFKKVTPQIYKKALMQMENIKEK